MVNSCYKDIEGPKLEYYILVPLCKKYFTDVTKDVNMPHHWPH